MPEYAKPSDIELCGVLSNLLDCANEKYPLSSALWRYMEDNSVSTNAQEFRDGMAIMDTLSRMGESVRFLMDDLECDRKIMEVDVVSRSFVDRRKFERGD